jgi:hypothetical protein
MLFLAFLAGFFGSLLFALVLKWCGLIGTSKLELEALEAKTKAELDSRLFTLSEQFNTSLRQLEPHKPNPFIPYDNEQTIRNIKQASAEFGIEDPWMPADHAPGAGLP